MVNSLQLRGIRFGLVCFFIILPKLASAQQSPNLKSFVSPTPTAQSLGKYGEVPVSLYNGIPQVSIPIHTVKARGVELPVSLSYHAGGIRVDEIASNVGLGWSLNAGGVITRAIRKTPDDLNGVGYFDRRVTITTRSQDYFDVASIAGSNFNLMIPPNGLLPGGDNLWMAAYDNEGDAEPDIFYFNFGNYSGKFFMDESGAFVSIPLQDIKIERSEYTTTGVTRWIITTPDGVKYIFGKTDVGVTPVRDARETTSTTIFPTITTAWYLVEVITPYNDKINIYYLPETYQYDVKDSETSNYILASTPGFPMDPALGPDQKNISTKFHNGLKLTSISSNTSTMTFTSGSRMDLSGSSMVTRIDIQNPSGRLNKSFDFSYSYFNGTGGGSNSLRLRLDFMEEYAGVSPNRISGGKHIFDYNVAVNLPNWDPNSKGINSQDLWGFYNGADNSILTQSLKADIAAGQLIMQGARRHTSPDHARANVLTKITYPTGGFTAFDFESNQVFASDKDFQFLNAAPVVKSEFIVVVSREPTVEKTITLKDPDPLNGKIPFQMMARAMVHACPSDAQGFPTCYYMYLEGVSPTVYPKTMIKEGITSILLDPGTYKISGIADSGMESIYKVKDVQAYHLTVQWQEFPTAVNYTLKENKNIGGLRIKRITNYSATGNLDIKRYEYNKFGTNESSGVLVNYPQPFATIFRVTYDPGGEFASEAKIADYLQVRSYPSSPLLSTQSSTVGYSNVTELSGEFGENGKTEYTFTTASDHGDIIRNHKPFPQATSYDWRRGLLKLQSIYLYDPADGNFKIIRSVTNSYTFFKNPRDAYGFAFEKYGHAHSGGSTAFMITGANNYYVASYKVTTEFYFKHQEVIREYSPAGSANAKETTINYDYGYANGHYQLTSKTERNSNNSVYLTTYKYPKDLTLTGEPETGRATLDAKFMRNVVLEESVTKDGSLLVKTVNNYKVVTGIPVLASVEVQTETNPIEQRLEIVTYDDSGNVVRQKKKDDVDNTFIWAHNKTYPIAQIQNALESDVAYTSFETTDAPYWTFNPPSHPTLVTGISRTGDKFITMPAGTTITRPGLSPTTSYVVSYWSKNGSYSVNSTTGTAGSTINGWTYYEHAISNPGGGFITLTGTGSIDELRLFPKNAQMVTYCYNPGVGIFCSTDANNATTTYEYDLLGRLKVIRDTNQKILKTLVYHYKGE